MPAKCVHKGCGKTFSNFDEDCVYHPGPPVFHEGQKGWACCKPRVLTFDEFLSIAPCTTGKHSNVDDMPVPELAAKNVRSEDVVLPPKPIAAFDGAQGQSKVSQQPQVPHQRVSTTQQSPQESESDDNSIAVPANQSCRRKGCYAISSAKTNSSRDDEECVHHPGHPLFHEGSKGWTCCKRRVLEFDEFMKIEGCKRKKRHFFIGSSKKDSGEETMMTLRHDFYQTPTVVIASLYLKKIDKGRAKIVFLSPTMLTVDLPTTDNKRYKADIPLFGQIDTTQSTSKIMGTKLELTLVKLDGASWPTFRSDEQATSEILQIGNAGKA